MNRRYCMCLFVLVLVSNLIAGQDSWMIYVNHVSLSIQVF